MKNRQFNILRFYGPIDVSVFFYLVVMVARGVFVFRTMIEEIPGQEVEVVKQLVARKPGDDRMKGTV